MSRPLSQVAAVRGAIGLVGGRLLCTASARHWHADPPNFAVDIVELSATMANSLSSVSELT